MPLILLFALICLAAAFLSLWIVRTPKVWGVLTTTSILSGMMAGVITWTGLVFIVILATLWILYRSGLSFWAFLSLIVLSICFYLRVIPGYVPYFFTPKFAIGLQNPLVGLFPLALFVPLAKKRDEWNQIVKEVLFGCIGIGLLATLAWASGAVRLEYTALPYMEIRAPVNFLLTCVPEEGFYRGFVQTRLCAYFHKIKHGKIAALVLTSLLFSVAHIFWSPNIGILLFTFLASLLYGLVYMRSGKIESAIFCHFLLNMLHMTCFSYHAR